MPYRKNRDGVGPSVTHDTWFPFAPVELGRAGNAVATLSVKENGTGGGSSSTTNTATTNDGNGADLTVDLTIGSGVVSAAAVGNAAGTGYRVGDKVTVTAADAGTNDNVVLMVETLTYTN